MHPDPALAFATHDHSRCSGAAIAQAEILMAARNQRLTPVRKRTLEILLQAHKALGAYEVLDKLVDDGFRRQPPVAYRALDFLVAQGLAHRIRRLNAFAACMYPGRVHVPAFLICEGCQALAELPGQAVAEALDTAAPVGFKIDRLSIEAAGLCLACRT
ncbi:Fur family zinc uptake transcriptional regulator [Rhodovulum imhoffii]|uniref:Fur family zinc uptake transcriptional regulator n=1 Tax=Rhodovulum imhoffii TaxID=365340 RepID=A0A2T5BVY3_9RHOB|nr:Fur family transcriptional regulator [Rhodovulum imhoffii]MBK5933559.1 Fur family transcriptional regulator [Rhodovulum imhoffii]PTN03809.1 Fur family zinc uptake transcriptional regulator [Rhodovulum imhoffii]